MNFLSSGLDALRHLRTAALAASVVVLAACGSNITSGDVSGTAAVGAPLANATVSLLCASGGTPTTATTSSAGKYNMSLGSSCAAPYFLKVVGIDTSVTPNVTTTLYAFADAAGNVNITPLTDIAARFATGNNPDAEFEAVKAASKKAGDLWNSASATEGKAKLLETLAGLGLNTSGINDVLHGAFNAVKGDKTDDLLEALKTKRGGVSLADLADKALKLGGSPGDKPWNALFRVGQNEIKLNLTGCKLFQYVSTPSIGSFGMPGYIPGSSSETSTTVTSAVLTLTRNQNSFTASITPNPANTSVTFRVVELGTGLANVEAGFSISSRAGTPSFVDISGGSGSGNLGQNFELNSSPDSKLVSIVEVSDSEVSGPLVQRARFSNSSYSPSYQDTTIVCDTIDTPLTRSTVGSFQPQSRLASIASVSPTITLTSSLAIDRDPGGMCYYGTEQSSTLVEASPSYITYSYAVSADGAISLNGVNVGDFLSGTVYPEAIYYEQTYFGYPDGGTGLNVRILFDQRRGFRVERNPSSQQQSCSGRGIG